MNNPELPLVSVCLITYNHEKYIAQAIESALMQQTAFKYEIIIGEDCSTDDTRAIVRCYADQHPERISALLPERNQGAHINFIATLNECEGRYIAILEGDDYWTDPNKLQKQVDYLTQNPDCSMCAHPVYFIYENSSAPPLVSGYPPKRKEKYTLKDIARLSFTATGSVMIRNSLVTEFPHWYYELAMGDWPFFLMVAQYGDIGFIDEVLGAYRIHEKGYWTGMMAIEKKKRIINAIDTMDEYLKYKYHGEMMSTRYTFMYGIASLYERQHDIKNARQYFVDSLKYMHYYSLVPPIAMVKLFIKLYFPFWEKSYSLRKKVSHQKEDSS